MAKQDGKYNIKAISKILGIQPGTLRAWERRYQFIAPVRNELGYRLYTDEHIKILKWLIKKVNEGFTISQAVSLLEKRPANFEEGTQQDGSQINTLTEELLNTLLDFNEMKAQEIINLLFGMFTIEKVVFEIFKRILETVRGLWDSGKITKAHEQYTVAILRSRIEVIFHSLPQNSFLPKAITVCSPEEVDQIGLLMLSFYLRRKGWDVIFLGTGIPEKDIDEVVKMMRPDYLFLSCNMSENLTASLSLVTQFSLNYKNLRIGLEGSAVNSMKKSEKEQFSAFILGEDPKEWEKWLDKSTAMTNTIHH